MRKEFMMSAEELNTLLDACKPTPVMFLSGGIPMANTPQENANAAWNALGKKLGFAGSTVKPVSGKEQQYFTAEVVESDG